MDRASFFLNGCAGSGKTTVARALQAACAYQLLHLSLDGWLGFQGEAKWSSFPNRQEVWDRMLDGFHGSIAAVIDAGTAVVVDHVLQERRWLPVLARSLAERNVYFIAVTCSRETAQRRIDERGRAERDERTIPWQLERIHRHGRYDLVVDTEAQRPAEIAVALIALAEARPPAAFAALAAAEDL